MKIKILPSRFSWIKNSMHEGLWGKMFTFMHGNIIFVHKNVIFIHGQFIFMHENEMFIPQLFSLSSMKPFYTEAFVES